MQVNVKNGRFRENIRGSRTEGIKNFREEIKTGADGGAGKLLWMGFA